MRKTLASILAIGVFGILVYSLTLNSNVLNNNAKFEITQSFVSLDEELENDCSQAKEWFDTKLSDVDYSYTGIASLPEAYQRVVFVNATAIQKSQIWKDYLTTYLYRENLLTEVQKEHLSSFIKTIDKRLFIDKNLPSEFEAEVKEIYGFELARKMFSTLGYENQNRKKIDSDKPVKTISKDVKVSKVNYTEILADCGCSTSSDWCPDSVVGAWEFECTSGANDCVDDDSDWGCGTLWLYNCNGDCVEKFPEYR